MRPEYILIHGSGTKDSETLSWSAIRRYHIYNKGWRAIGYHFGLELVSKEYEILTGRMMNEIGAHCKQDRMNYRSLGICFVGDFDLIEPPVSQWELGVKFVKSLLVVFDIPIQRVYGHNHFAKYKTCPGTKFDTDKFINQLK